ncbi:fungal-specific transcription factor domain-containing protein [Xylogone sp. PMI_703]|nr:fungal-specific transcription factor domain-containing protein [Xylogone sp. PMI_703]
MREDPLSGPRRGTYSPPKLRTKTGCLKCRARRKKCDERRPTCTACLRNGHACVWFKGPASHYKDHGTCTTTPSNFKECHQFHVSESIMAKTVQQNISHHSNTSTATCALYATHVSSFPPSLDSPINRRLVHYLTNNFLPMLVRMHAHPDFHKHAYMMSLALHIPSVLDILLACVASHLAGKTGEQELQDLASKYYSLAIQGTRKKLDSETITGAEDWLFITIIFFYLYEIWSPNQLFNAACHIRGAIQLMAFRNKALQSGLSSAPLSFLRITAESVLYHLTTLSLFIEDLDGVSEDPVFEHTQAFLGLNIFPKSSTTVNSPVLGSSADMWRIILLIGRLSRNVPLTSDELHTATALNVELRVWHAQLSSIQSDTGIRTEAEITQFDESHRLYIVAVRILLLMILNLNVAIDMEDIQDLVSEGAELLHSGLTYTRCSQFFCWPTLILGSVSIEQDHIATIYKVLADMWNRSYSGYVMKARQTLDAIWCRSSIGGAKTPFRTCGDILAELHWTRDTSTRI